MNRTKVEEVEEVSKAMRYLATKKRYRVRCKAGEMTLQHYISDDLWGGWYSVAAVSVTGGYEELRPF